MTLRLALKQNRPGCVVAQEFRHDDLHARRRNDRLHADRNRFRPASGNRTDAPQGEAERRCAASVRAEPPLPDQTSGAASPPSDGSGSASSSPFGSEMRSTDTTFSPSAVLKMVTPLVARLAMRMPCNRHADDRPAVRNQHDLVVAADREGRRSAGRSRRPSTRRWRGCPCRRGRSRGNRRTTSACRSRIP